MKKRKKNKVMTSAMVYVFVMGVMVGALGTYAAALLSSPAPSPVRTVETVTVVVAGYDENGNLVYRDYDEKVSAYVSLEDAASYTK